MANCSKYQHDYWYPRVAARQNGEYCANCGISEVTQMYYGRRFTGLVLHDKDNSDDHTIQYNTVDDFDLLCRRCNYVLDPRDPPPRRQKSQSEHTNERAEKPMMEWLMRRLLNGQETSYDWFVSNGAFEFDVSPVTIERNYSRKFFVADSSPFGLEDNQFGKTYIILKDMEGKNEKGRTDMGPQLRPIPSESHNPDNWHARAGRQPRA